MKGSKGYQNSDHKNCCNKKQVTHPLLQTTPRMHSLYERAAFILFPYTYIVNISRCENVWVRWSGVVKSSHFWCLLLFFFFNFMDIWPMLGYYKRHSRSKDLSFAETFHSDETDTNNYRILAYCESIAPYIVSRIYETNAFPVFWEINKIPGSKKDDGNGILKGLFNPLGVQFSSFHFTWLFNIIHCFCICQGITLHMKSNKFMFSFRRWTLSELVLGPGGNRR